MSHREQLELLISRGAPRFTSDTNPIIQRDQEAAHREWCARVNALATLAFVDDPHEHHWVYAGLTFAHAGQEGQVARQRCEDFGVTKGCGAERLVT